MQSRYAVTVNKGVIALLGSGETAPGMTRVHRELLSRYENPVAVNLDTSYGFQENVAEMSKKITDYFSISLSLPMKPLRFPSFAGASGVERALFKSQVRDANYVFAGPGSPSYALKQWQQVDIVDDLRAVLENDGTVIFSSAAALSLGAFAAPIYEIYKAGQDPYWLEALNLLSATGLNCVVIPHFDNSEGENYDTSCCYIGLRRLELLERELPAGTATLGIDEHTAVIIDLSARTLRVTGRANAYWRVAGGSKTLLSGTTTPLSDLREPVANGVASSDSLPNNSDEPRSALELAEAISCGTGNVESHLAALVKLAETGGGNFIDPSSIVDGILAARLQARDEKNFKLADTLREILNNAGIEIKDGPNGTTWVLSR